MSFTTAAIIRTHLLTSTLPELVIRNQAGTFDKHSEIELQHHGLLATSDVVKLDSHGQPLSDNSVVIKREMWMELEHKQLVPGTVVVAMDETLTTVYAEEVDFQIDYTAGRIRRVLGGAIQDGQSLLLFYTTYTLFERDTDYEIDSNAGIVTRSAGGAIPDGASMFMDYRVAAGAMEEDLIVQAMLEAEDLIVRSLSSDYNADSTDQGICTGATELSLAIICRALAVEALSRRTSTDGSGRAKEWQQLSRFYEEQAWSTLAPFLLPVSMRSTFRQTRETN